MAECCLKIRALYFRILSRRFEIIFTKRHTHAGNNAGICNFLTPTNAEMLLMVWRSRFGYGRILNNLVSIFVTLIVLHRTVSYGMCSYRSRMFKGMCLEYIWVKGDCGNFGALRNKRKK
jgi:hypothetical protein